METLRNIWLITIITVTTPVVVCCAAYSCYRFIDDLIDRIKHPNRYH